MIVNSVTVVPDATPPYALPFKLKKANVAVKKAKKQLKVTVKRLPTGTNVLAALGKKRAVAGAPAGTAKLTLPRRKGKLRITATPPGQKASAVAVKIA